MFPASSRRRAALRRATRLIYLHWALAVGVTALGGALHLLLPRPTEAYTFIGAATALILLVELSLYWQRVRGRLLRREGFPGLRRLQVIFSASGLLLLAFPAALLTGFLDGTLVFALPDPWIGGGFYLFALFIFMHGFLVKLIRSADDQRARTRRRQVDARLMRELIRAEKRLGGPR